MTSLKNRQSFTSSRTPRRIHPKFKRVNVFLNHTILAHVHHTTPLTQSSNTFLLYISRGTDFSRTVLSRFWPLLRFDVTQWTLHKRAADRYRIGPTDGSGTGRYCLPLFLLLPCNICSNTWATNICSALHPLSFRPWSTDELRLALVNCYYNPCTDRATIPMRYS
jgi:hypothetical protein